MKLTKTKMRKFVKHKLQTSRSWMLRGLVVIFNRQTLSEQTSETTHDHNNRGFTATDAEFLTSLAKQHLKGRVLSQKQMSYLAKIMPKYWAQILEVADVEKIHNQAVEHFAR